MQPSNHRSWSSWVNFTRAYPSLAMALLILFPLWCKRVSSWPWGYKIPFAFWARCNTMGWNGVVPDHDHDRLTQPSLDSWKFTSLSLSLSLIPECGGPTSSSVRSSSRRRSASRSCWRCKAGWCGLRWGTSTWWRTIEDNGGMNTALMLQVLQYSYRDTEWTFCW